MRSHIHTGARTQRGITTAEYAVGTAAGAGLAALLYVLAAHRGADPDPIEADAGGFGEQLLHTLFDHVLGLLGIG